MREVQHFTIPTISINIPFRQQKMDCGVYDMAKYEVTIQERNKSLLFPESADWAEMDGQKIYYSVHAFDAHTTYLRVGLRLYRIDNVTSHGRDVEFSVDGRMVAGEVLDEQSLLLQKLGFRSESEHTGGALFFPMAGEIFELLLGGGRGGGKEQAVGFFGAVEKGKEGKRAPDGNLSGIHG